MNLAPNKIRNTREGFLLMLANHYTSRGVQSADLDSYEDI